MSPRYVSPEHTTECATKIPGDLAREIARQGEVRLIALLNIGTAADRRATTLCVIFVATCIGVVTAVLAYAASDHPQSWLIVNGFISAVFLFAAAFFAAVACAPRDFHIAGGNPDILREWSWDGGQWREEIDMLDATAQRYAQSIKKNEENLEIGSKLIIGSLLFSSAAPLLGIISIFDAITS